MNNAIQFFLKRLFDFTVALTLIVFLSPLLLIVSLIILITDGMPILFSQLRPGLNEKIFKIYKFRTMTVDTSDNPSVDNSRTTKLGHLLRKTSLDELPQLFNVLIGNLSLVGPRPLLVEYLPLYNKEQKKRHTVKPGITGWAQINGRNAITWEQKFKLDVWYVDNWSFALDIKILFLTFMKVIKRSGVDASQSTTMEKFRG